MVAIDTTASMEGDIADARKEATTIARTVKRANPNSRVGLVQYRDWQPGNLFSNGKAAEIVQDLTTDEEKSQRAVDSLTKTVNSYDNPRIGSLRHLDGTGCQLVGGQR